MNVEIKIEGIKELSHKIEKLPKLATKDVVEAMNNTVDHAKDDVRNYMELPVPEYPPIDTGKLRDSWKTDHATLVTKTAKMGTDSPYAPFVVFGTRPHFPPLAPLREWAKRRWHLNDSEAYVSAKGIAKKIGAVGTPPRQFFDRAVANVYPYFQKQLVAVANKISQRWRSENVM